MKISLNSDQQPSTNQQTKKNDAFKYRHSLPIRVMFVGVAVRCCCYFFLIKKLRFGVRNNGIQCFV